MQDSEAVFYPLKDAMRQTVQDAGPEIFLNKDKMKYYLADLCPQDEKGRNRVETALRVGAGEEFYRIIKKNGEYDPECRGRFLAYIQGNDFNLEFCKFIVDVFEYAIGYGEEKRDIVEETNPALWSEDTDKSEKPEAITKDLWNAESVPDAAWDALPDTGDDSDHPGDEIQRKILEAKNGNVEAQVALGQMYGYGTEISKNYSFSFYWYMQAANQGNADAMYNVALFYFYGKGMDKDYEAACYWFAKSAENDHIGALNKLGYMCEHGLYQGKDTDAALYYYQEAEKRGSTAAKANLHRLWQQSRGMRSSPDASISQENQNVESGTVPNAGDHSAFFEHAVVHQASDADDEEDDQSGTLALVILVCVAIFILILVANN